MAEHYKASPYYDEANTVLGWGVWCNYADDWAIDDGLDESLSKDIADYLNGINGEPNGLGQYMVRGIRSDHFLGHMWIQHGRDTVNDTLRFYGFML